MDASERKKKMIDAAMKTVALKGLDSFSVAQAASYAGINEALVYRDFGTKENLLNECFLTVNKEIMDHFTSDVNLHFNIQGDVAAQMHDHMDRFYKVLVEGGYKTLFYQQYRDSSYKMDEEMKQKFQEYDVKGIFQKIMSKYLMDKGYVDFLCVYLIDGTVLFAKRVINGEIPNNEEYTKRIWNLLNYGMRGLSQVNS
jgi:AcrR family transcriptional regulator